MARKNGREATRMKAISTISRRVNEQVDTDNPKLTDGYCNRYVRRGKVWPALGPIVRLYLETQFLSATISD